MLNNEQLMSLPVPTPEQTARFAAHVVDDHLRYKPLPFFLPGALFVFFPDPYAGHEIWRRGKKFLVSRIVSEASPHEAAYEPYEAAYKPYAPAYSTEEYLDRFGHWNYWVDDTPRATKPKQGPWLHCAETGGRELLADHLKKRWSCRLTAFLKPFPMMLLNREPSLKREARNFEYQSSPERMQMVDEIIERYTKHKPGGESAIIARYRKLLRIVRGGIVNLLDAEAFRFMQAEAPEQRRMLLETLEHIRTSWSYHESRIV